MSFFKKGKLFCREADSKMFIGIDFVFSAAIHSDHHIGFLLSGLHADRSAKALDYWFKMFLNYFL